MAGLMPLADRWTSYGMAQPSVAAGWSFEALVGPSVLGGANGIVEHRGQLLVTQVFGSQVTAPAVMRTRCVHWLMLMTSGVGPSSSEYEMAVTGLLPGASANQSGLGTVIDSPG